MKLRVVVLDIEENLRRLISLIVHHKGHDVVTSSEPFHCSLYTGTETSCSRKNPCADLMIVDSRMPGISALSLIRKQISGGCKEASQNKLVLSTKRSDQESHYAQELGCKLFKKPFKVEEISNWIDECEKTINSDRKLSPLKMEHLSS